MQVSKTGDVSPLDEGFADLVALLTVVFTLSTRVWPEYFENTTMSVSLLFFSTLGVYYVLPDIATSNALLLSILLLQFNLCLFLVRGRHQVTPGHHYTMSIHYYPPIIILTFVLAYFVNSPTMYSDSTQLQWLPFTVPYLGVSVLLFFYISFVQASRTGPFLPR